MKSTLRFRLFVCLTLAFPSGCVESAHTHQEEPDAQEQNVELEPISVTRFGERALLFMEHPRIVRGESVRFLAHFSVLATGEPVRAGSVTLEIGSTRLHVDAPKRDGLFTPEGTFPATGAHAARLVVASDQVEESFDLGTITVHEDQHGAAHAAEAEATDEPTDAVAFLLEQQWKVKLLLTEAQPRSLARRLVVPARITAPEGAEAVISAGLGGRLVAPPTGSFPRSGDVVSAGQVLAFVEPHLSPPDVAQLRALDLEFDLEALDVLRAVGEARAHLRFAEREFERTTQLREEGLSTRQQLDLAEQNLAVAREQNEAAVGMKTSLDALVAQRGARSGSATTPAFALRAPIAGRIVEALHTAGESVASDAEVFRVLDSSRLWLEGRVFEFDLPALHSASSASASFEALPDLRVELTAPSNGAPYIGREVDLTTRTVVVRYELDNSDDGVRVGMSASLEIATGAVDAAVSIPFEAVVFDQGLPTAYVMLEGELFQKRELELGVKDGAWVEVRRGIQARERLATRGAYLVKLAALAPANFGHGHAH